MKKSLINILKVSSALLLVVALSPRAEAAEPRVEAEAAWERAIAACESGDYTTAIEEFERIDELGYESDELYYNLANAYYKKGEGNVVSGRSFAGGELGRAVLNYRRALMLNPTHEDARYNLDITIDRTDDIREVPNGVLAQLWHSMQGAMSANGWTILSIAMLFITLALVLVYMLSKSVVMRKVSFFTAIATLLLFITTTALALSQRSAHQSDNRGVLVCENTEAVHSEPNNYSKVIRTHSQGVTLKLLRSKGEWVEVQFADGEKGWVRSVSVEKI